MLKRQNKTSVREPIRILFVCLGNICRSPLAEALFRHRIRERGLEAYFEVDSAGIAGWHEGERPCPGTLATLARLGISSEGLRARQIRKEDFERFDEIIVMESSQKQDLLRFVEDMMHKAKANGRSWQPKAHIERLLAYAPQADVGDVPDPYETGVHDEVYALIRQGVEGLLDHLVETMVANIHSEKGEGL